MERFKKITIIFLLAAGLLNSVAPPVCLANRSSGTKPASVLLQEGLYAEEIEGDLNSAIQVYERILKDFLKNRPVAAKALLHIGLCKEKLGLNEAINAYQKVVVQYPEQQGEVAIAKERIAKLSKALEDVARKPTFRKIRIPTKPGNGVLSPDGKKLAFVSKGSIWVVPVRGKVSPDIAGEPVRLPGTEGAWPWGMRWSADGKWIVYNTLPSEDHVGICIVPSSGGKVKRIVNRYRAGHRIHNYLLSLSPDGKKVAFASDEKEQIQLFTVSVEGGDVNRLTEDGGTQPAFSPDGKKIAYVKEKPQKTEIYKGSDVWVIPAAGGIPFQVSDLKGEATGPIWSPNGKMIAFTRKAILGSDMSKEICIVPVSETGKPEASPTQIELPLETWDFLAGWTPDNKIGVLLKNTIHFAIYTVPASGGNATQVTPQGYYYSPRWSPDGKRIYLRWPDGPDGIASVPSEGGEISISPIDADSRSSQPLQWGGNVVSPDGKKIVFCASKKDNKSFPPSYIYTIPVEGGEPKQLTISPGRGRDRFPCWSPEGKSIAFIRYSDASWNKKKHDYINNICIVRPEGGEVRQLTSESDKVARATIAWSPDGKSIAYYSEDKTIRVIPVKGGESREVVKVDKVNEWWDELAWSRDGKKIAYSSKGSIWVVSLDGGEPEEIKTGLDAKVTHISWSPDGKKIACTASKGGDTELWLMENFLPEIEPTKIVPDEAFGPVIERIIYTDETGKDCFFDLDTGKAFSIPQGLTRSSDPEKGIPWILENGIDFVNCVGRLQLWDMVAVEVEEKIWDSEDAVEINSVLMRDPSKEFLPTEQEEYIITAPFIYAFETREGGIGLLQILEKRNTYLKIRYKMLRELPVRGDAAKAMELLSGLKALMGGVVRAIESDDPNTALLLLDKLITQSKQFKPTVEDTSIEAAVKAGLEMLDPLRDALEKKQMDRAKSLLAALNQMGPAIEAAIEKGAAQQGQSKKETGLRRR